MDSYDLYLEELRDQIDLDREVRLQVLDTAARIEFEFIAVAVFYLGGGSIERQELVERLTPIIHEG